MDRTAAVTNVVVALIGAGLLSYGRDSLRAWKARRDQRLPSARDAISVREADASLLVVAKARDELEEDNRRLRVTISEERHRHAEDRATWAQEKSVLRGEIDALEAKLRALLAEVTALRTKTGA